ncbi:uncharacterized protein LOC113312202 [Papaver somniferum]|uniref:uncharacterized protein LOC113312202 n=1 Tax=Papaver somniferum TaxID=3469 RepID=UPI000E6FB46F|nr:uncharacterized protein LOC113312202 [Papaver somniferum]
MEYLSKSLEAAQNTGKIQGISTSQSSTPINHLLFADDCLMFFQASDSGLQIIKDILEHFGSISGQVINYSKSSTFICGDVTKEVKLEIIHKLGVKKLCSSEKYLGLPILLGKSKTNSFKSIKEAYGNRIQGWNSKTLNQADRTTLVKTVLNSIPAHYMSNFKIPKNTLQQLDSLQRNFWWGHIDNKGINFISWDFLCVSKEHGGLAFRNLEKYNLALITKLAWRLCTKSDKQWVINMKNKYAPHCNFLHLQQPHNNSSWMWKGIEKGLEVERKYYQWEIRCGTKALVRYDKWITGPDGPQIPREDYREPARIVKVSDLILVIPEGGIHN